jgi:hypothetical protein
MDQPNGLDACQIGHREFDRIMQLRWPRQASLIVPVCVQSALQATANLHY